jgi:hypothetical protein
VLHALVYILVPSHVSSVRLRATRRLLIGFCFHSVPANLGIRGSTNHSTWGPEMFVRSGADKVLLGRNLESAITSSADQGVQKDECIAQDLYTRGI